MRGPFPIRLGDQVEMRKPHACGTNHWVVIRTGMDIRIQCVHCGRTVLLPRPRFTRSLRRLISSEGAQHEREGPAEPDG